MLNNLTNFFSIITRRRIKTELENSDIIAIGTKQSSNLGDYKATAIKFSDLATQLSASAKWAMANTAFVSPTNGDDTTAVLGDGNKPWSTLAGAVASGATRIFLLPDNYTESHTLATGTTYYCYPGVIFNEGVLSAAGVSLIDTKWLGYAQFANSSNIDLRPLVAERFVLEIDSIISSGSNGFYIEPTNYSEIHIDIRTIDASYGNEAAPMFNLRGNISGTVNVKKVVGYYKALNCRSNKANLVVNIDEMIVLDGGPYGNAGGYKAGLVIENTGDAIGDFTITANINNLVNNTTSLTNDGAVQIVNMGSNNKVVVNVKRASSVTNHLVRLVSVNPNLITINGETGGNFLRSEGSSTALLKNCTVKQATASTMVSSIIYIEDSTISNTGVQNTMYCSNASGKLYMKNVGVEGDPAASIFDSVAGSTYGFDNVLTTQDVGAVNPVNAYGFVGHVVEPNYVAPVI